MTRAEALEVLREVERVHKPPVTRGMPMGMYGDPWPSLIALINSAPDLIRLLEEPAA